MHITYPHQHINIRLMWVFIQRITEEKNRLYFSLDNLGCNLGISTLRTLNFQSGILGMFTGRPGGDDINIGLMQKIIVFIQKRDHFGLFPVMGNYG